ncbi:MAG: sulfatase [Myxococcota bacterium]
MLSPMLAAALAVSVPAAGRAAPDRELVVLILIDALRADRVGVYGYAKPTTPVLDALATMGTRYTRAYVNAPWTRASVASFFTGLNASRHRTETEKSKLPEGMRTMTRRLGEAGWKTTGFSANGNGGSLANLDEGYDLFEDPTNTYKRTETRKRCHKKYGKTVPPERLREAILEDCKRYIGLPTGEFIVHRALRHLKTSRAKKEFLFLFLVDPHDKSFTYFAPPRLEKQFVGRAVGTKRPRVLWEKDNQYSAEHRATVMGIYDAGIRYSDEALGQFLEGLETLGLRDQTTLFVTADHGEGFGEHDFYLHAHHFWEEVIHVPLIAAGPRFKARVDDRLTQAIDVSATILDIAGAKTDGIQGFSLLKPQRKNAHVISEYNEFGIHRQAIIGELYKVIWQRAADEAWYMRSFSDKFTPEEKKAFFPSVTFDTERVRVFGLKDDPKEKNDLSEKMPAEAARLLETLREFVAASDALAANMRSGP